MFIILEGSAAIVRFNDSRYFTGHVVLDHKEGNYGLEISEWEWHMVIVLEPGTVMYEVKDGPYAP